MIRWCSCCYIRLWSDQFLRWLLSLSFRPAFCVAFGVVFLHLSHLLGIYIMAQHGMAITTIIET
jgi:hypothetical protein